MERSVEYVKNFMYFCKLIFPMASINNVKMTPGYKKQVKNKKK